MMRLLSCRPVLAALVLIALVSARAEAHPIHTTLTVITYNAGRVTLSVRAFADDFSSSVATFAGKPAPTDSSVVEADVRRYLLENVRVMTGSGAVVALAFCGVRREGDLYLLCLRAPLASGLGNARVSNKLLTELHSDQINIVRVERGDSRQTLLLTKKSGPARISG